jgi:DNA-binding transcriptional MerR regulator
METATTGREELTVEQLAQRTDMTVRNLREWQSLGILPPPRKRGRTGYYGPDHVERVERIRGLRADGFPLELIRRILEGGGGPEEELVEFAHAVRTPFQDEAPQVVALAELARRFKVTDPSALERALELGLLRRRDDGQIEIPNPRLARIGEALMELGLTLDELLELTARVRRHQEAVAEIFISVFRDRFWQPFLEAGQPAGRWGEILSTLEDLRPLALDAVIATFKLAMDGAAERAVGDEVDRLSGPGEERSR